MTAWVTRSALLLVLLLQEPPAFAAEPTPVSPSTVVPIRVAVWPGPPPDEKTADPGTLARLHGLEDLVGTLRELRLRHGLQLPVEVTLHGGVYRVTEPLRLTALDSGSPDASVLIRAAPGEQPVISGSRVVADWRVPRPRELPDRLPASARAHVLVADLSEIARADLGELTLRGFGRPRQPGHATLLWRGIPMQLARWPDDGYLAITAVPDGKLGRRLRFAGNPPRGIEQEPDLWAFGFWFVDWAGQHQPVEFDRADGTLTVGGTRSPTYGIVPRTRGFYLENALAALDQPGEWWIDRNKRRAWFWPPEQPAPGDAELVVTPTLLQIEHAAHIRLSGLTFVGSRADALLLDDVDDVVVSDCTIRAAGGIGASIKGRGSGIERCTIEDVADSAVTLDGGDRRTLEPGRLFVRDSEIRRYGQWVRTYTAAVELDGVGNSVTSNHIHDAPHMGVYLHGNNHRIERNLFHDLIQDTDDAGAIYQYLDWTARGTLIRDNIFCRLRPVASKAMGVYLDAFASGATVTGNHFLDVPYGILMNGGSDNVIADNLMVGGTAPLWIDASGLRWLRYHFDEPSDPLRRRLQAVPYQGSDFAQRYPGLPSVMEGDPGMPKRNVVTDNRIIAESIGRIDDRARSWSLIRDNVVEPSSNRSRVLAEFPSVCREAP